MLWLAALPAGLAMGSVGLAVFVQMYRLTGSASALGLLGLVQFASLLVGTLGGSTVVDHFDRRTLLLLTQAGFAVSATTLWMGSRLDHPPIALIYLASALGSAVASLHFPTRSAMIPGVVDRDELTTSMTLDVVVWNVTMIAGPVVGGAVLSRLGLPSVYAIGILCQVVTLSLMLRLGRQPAGARRDGRLGLAAIRQGFHYLRPRKVLKGLLWVDLIAMVFGMRRALFPVLASQQFGRGPEAVGLLMAAIPMGALAASLTAGWLSNVHRQGMTLLGAAVVWSVAVTAFGLTGAALVPAVLLLGVAGAADIVAAILRSSIIQHEVPEWVRGRVWGINFLVLNGGPRLGDATAGLAAGAWGATFSVVGGGLASLAGIVLFAVASPELVRYTSTSRIERADDVQLARAGGGDAPSAP